MVRAVLMRDKKDQNDLKEELGLAVSPMAVSAAVSALVVPLPKDGSAHEDPAPPE